MFVFGALLMPFVHYVWMASSGHFGPAASAMHVHHATATPTDPSGSESGNLIDDPADLCDYSDLFASFSSPEPGFDTGIQPLPEQALVRAPETLLIQGTDTLLPPERGPPIA